MRLGNIVLEMSKFVTCTAIGGLSSYAVFDKLSHILLFLETKKNKLNFPEAIALPSLAIQKVFLQNS